MFRPFSFGNPTFNPILICSSFLSIVDNLIAFCTLHMILSQLEFEFIYWVYIGRIKKKTKGD